jgi:hypothetical protein
MDYSTRRDGVQNSQESLSVNGEMLNRFKWVR